MSQPAPLNADTGHVRIGQPPHGPLPLPGYDSSESRAQGPRGVSVVMDDLGKIAVIAGIMGALLLFGVLANRPEPVPAPIAEVVQESTRVVLPANRSLELLDPVYSEKAIYHDGTLRVAFKPTFVNERELESRLEFWLHNVSGDVINVLWDRCSLQLPSGNTVSVVNESMILQGASMGQILSIAPGADLFDAFIPLSEIVWEEEGPVPSVGVLDQGAFTLVLAVERATRGECVAHPQMIQSPPGADCPPGPPAIASVTCSRPGREIVHYTFRFVVR